MRVKKLVAISFSVLVCGCTTVTAPRVAAPLTLEQMGFDEEAKALVYHIGGIKSMMLSNDTEQAERLFKLAIKDDSLFAPSYYELASIYLAKGNQSEALKNSLKANSIDSTNTWIQSQLGQIYINLEKYDNALDVYEKLVKLSPENPANHRILAALYQQQGQPFTAIIVLDSAEYKLGRIEELSSYKRQLLLSLNLQDRAIKETQALINDFPYNYENYIALGQMYAHIKNDSLALQNFLKANELSPNNVEVLIALNDYYKTRNDIPNFMATTRQLFSNTDVVVDDKVAMFEDLTKDREFYGRNLLPITELATILYAMYPQSVKVIELYASNQMAQGKMDEALKTYKSHIGSDSTSIEIYNTIIDIETYLNKPDSVAKYIDMALKQYPDNGDLHVRKGSSLAYMKRNKEALETYKESLKFAKTDSLKSVILGVMGDLVFTQGEQKQTYKYYDQALKLNPNNIMVLNNYAYFLSEENRDLERAKSMIEIVMKDSPSNPTYIDTYAWILHKLGDNQKAKKLMQQAISFDKKPSKELYMHYGDILNALGESYMATIYWRKALEAGYDAAEVEKRLNNQK